MLLTSCDGDNGTWETSKDKRWWAGEDGSTLRGYIDENGKSVSPDPFPEDSYFYFNRIRFEEDGKDGMYDENWKVAIPADYKSLGEYTEDGLIWFSEDGKEWGYLDKDGKVVIPEQFAGAYSFAGGIAVVFEKKGRWISLRRYRQERQHAGRLSEETTV